MRAWRSLVGGDEQPDRPNSQTSMVMMPRMCCIIFWICHKHNSLLVGPIQPSTKKRHGVSDFVDLESNLNVAFIRTKFSDAAASMSSKPKAKSKENLNLFGQKCPGNTIYGVPTLLASQLKSL